MAGTVYRVVILALGTRGDVQPLLAVADRWMALATAPPATAATATAASSSSSTRAVGAMPFPLAGRRLEVVMATHRELHDTLRPYAAHDRVSFRVIRSDCFRRAVRASDVFGVAEPTTAPAAKHVEAPSDDGGDGNDVGGWDISAETRRLERADCVRACADADFIAFNLFALIGYHIAEARGVSCACLSPYLIPSAPPHWFARAFAKQHPALYRALKRSFDERTATNGGSDSGGDSKSNSVPSATAAPYRVSWQEIDHWMWPLFSSADGSFRERYLTLSPAPLHVPETDAVCQPLPTATPLLYGMSPNVFARPGFWSLPTRRRQRPTHHAAASSASATEEEPDEANAPIGLTGFWLAGAKHSASFTPPNDLLQFLERRPTTAVAAASPPAASDVVYIGFGSMGSIGLLSPQLAADLTRSFIRALQTLGLRAVVATDSFRSPLPTDSDDAPSDDGDVESTGDAKHGFEDDAADARTTNKRTATAAADAPPLKRARKEVAAAADESEAIKLWRAAAATADFIYLLSGADIPHAWLFPRCCAVIHHGGSGTTAAGFVSGVPQLIVPFMFDQFFWARQVSWLGVGPEPIRLPRADDAAATSVDGDLIVESLAAAVGRPAFASNTAPASSSSSASAAAAADGDSRRDHPSAARELAERIRAEPDGCTVAVQRLNQFIAHSAIAGTRADGMRPHIRPPTLLKLTTAAAASSAAATADIKSDSPVAPFQVYALSREETVFLYDEIFRQRIYCQNGVALSEGSVILDIGANIGMFGLFVARELKRYTLISCEPIEAIARVCAQNLRLHGVAVVEMPDRPRASAAAATTATTAATSAAAFDRLHGSGVYLHRIGLSEPSACGESVEFVYYPNMSGNSTRAIHRSEKEEQIEASISADRSDMFLSSPIVQSCRVRTISDLIRAHGLTRIDVLKIDVEGEEASVLLGIDAAHWKMVQCITMEVHDHNSTRLKSIVLRLASHGFHVVTRSMSATSGDGNWHVYATRKPQPPPERRRRTLPATNVGLSAAAAVAASATATTTTTAATAAAVAPTAAASVSHKSA